MWSYSTVTPPKVTQKFMMRKEAVWRAGGGIGSTDMSTPSEHKGRDVVGDAGQPVTNAAGGACAPHARPAVCAHATALPPTRLPSSRVAPVEDSHVDGGHEELRRQHEDIGRDEVGRERVGTAANSACGARMRRGTRGCRVCSLSSRSRVAGGAAAGGAGQRRRRAHRQLLPKQRLSPREH
eukprot:2082919-Prymnesium_polylepis.1